MYIMRSITICIVIQLSLFQLGEGHSDLNRIIEKENKHHYEKSKNFSPVILIPGLGGSRLQAKLNKSSVPHFWCDKKSDYSDLWFNIFIPSIDCWVDNIKLSYDNIARTTRNTPGVHVRLLEQNKTDSVEWIGKYFGAYYFYIAKALAERGYIREKSIFGAPYDFRKGPNENLKWFDDLKQLTEDAYKINNNTYVTFIAHSMGGKMLLHFLQQMPQNWKDKYIKRAITLGVPWGGSIQAFRALSIGYDLGLFYLPTEKMNAVQKTFPSLVWLMPSKNFWKPNEIIAVIDNKNYTVRDIDQFFKDIGDQNVVEMRKDLDIYNNLSAPGIEMHCLFGSNIKTTESIYLNTLTKINKGNGDGEVNYQSLIGCEYWKNDANQVQHKIYQQEFPGVDHINILDNPLIMSYILDILT